MAFPDPVALAIAYLAPIIAPTPVSSRVPDPRPERFVQIRRSGGTAQVPVRDVARLDAIAWAPSETEAMQGLALPIRTAIWKLAGTDLLGPMVYRVEEFLGPRMDDDPLTGTPRVWATYTLAIRADDVIQRAP